MIEDYSIKDIMAQAFINIDFPAQYVATMKTPNVNNVGISDFYKAFCTKNKIFVKDGRNILFQPVLILGYMYTSFLLPQQYFFNNVPRFKIDQTEWGIKVEIDNNLYLQHIAKRIRNALAHNHIEITKNMNFTFWDADPQKKNIDISEAEAIYRFSFDDLMFNFIPKWNKIIKDLIINNNNG